MQQRVICYLVVLVLFSSLQPGKLQEGHSTQNEGNNAGVVEVFDEVKALLRIIKTKTNIHVKEFRSFRDQIEGNFRSLREDLTILNDSVSSLSMCLQEHKEQTAAELAELQTALTTTHSSLTNRTQQVETKLKTLTASLSQHTRQTASSLETANFRLEALRATTAQLSTDHQQIQTNISVVECMNAEENLQLQHNLFNNLTYNLGTIGSKVNTLYNQRFTCGGTGGWRRVFYMDMTDSSTTCPSGWQLTAYSKRTCGRATGGQHTCDSVTFPVIGGEYSRVCGRIKAYQGSSPDGFWRYAQERAITIDSDYVDGVSITHGSPRQHIWTFAAGAAEGNPRLNIVCPCDADHTIHIPQLIGNDYFCESGVNEAWDASRHFTFHPNDPLWDGEDCLSSSTCCSLHNPPYFVKQLPAPTTHNIEARICLDEPLSNENIAVELVELYVQ